MEPTGLVERWHGDGLGEADEVSGTLISALLPGFALEVSTLGAT